MADPFSDLMIAIDLKDLAAAQAALDAGADIDGVFGKTRRLSPDTRYFYSGTTPLAHAVRVGGLELIDWVASKGADLEAPVHGSDPSILVAVARQSAAPRKITRLLELGADPNAISSDHKTALHYACSAGKLASVRALLGAGARVDVGLCDPNYGVDELPTYTPLYECCVSRQLECALALLDAGANPNTGRSDSWLMSPLGMAIKQEDRRLIEALLEHGARTDPNLLAPRLEAEMRTILALP